MAALQIGDGLDGVRVTDRGGSGLHMIGQMAGQVFEPHDIAVLTVALDRSCTIMAADGDVRFRRVETAHYARETLARVILGQAGSGQRDPVSLSDAALSLMMVA